MSGPELMGWHLHPLAHGDRAEFREDVVGIATVVAIRGSRAISDVRRVDGIGWLVARELEVIRPNSVAVGIGIAKHSGLKDCGHLG